MANAILAFFLVFLCCAEKKNGEKILDFLSRMS